MSNDAPLLRLYLSLIRCILLEVFFIENMFFNIPFITQLRWSEHKFAALYLNLKILFLGTLFLLRKRATISVGKCFCKK